MIKLIAVTDITLEVFPISLRDYFLDSLQPFKPIQNPAIYMQLNDSV